MKKVNIIIGLVSLLFSAVYVSEILELEYPDHFPKPVYNFENNALTQSKINLGRALFYDPILSKDNTISCATCHSPYNAFAHTDHDLSHGINDEIGNRNAPALFNLAWQSTFMWDGAINHLDVQPLAPISHPKEMGETIKNITTKLQSNSIYPPLFQKAYGDSIITGEHILKAMAQFQLTLVSADAKYDRVVEGTARFTDQEQAGYALFQKSCNSCHEEPLFSSYGFANNGLPIDTTLNDYGKGSVSLALGDSLLFKIPSLRNLTYTYPYMHDGRFRKLKEVIQHYNELHGQENIADELKSIPSFTSNEQIDLIAFLLTLNDKNFVFDKKNKFPREILLPTEGN